MSHPFDSNIIVVFSKKIEDKYKITKSTARAMAMVVFVDAFRHDNSVQLSELAGEAACCWSGEELGVIPNITSADFIKLLGESSDETISIRTLYSAIDIINKK